MASTARNPAPKVINKQEGGFRWSGKKWICQKLMFNSSIKGQVPNEQYLWFQVCTRSASFYLDYKMCLENFRLSMKEGTSSHLIKSTVHLVCKLKAQITRHFLLIKSHEYKIQLCYEIISYNMTPWELWRQIGWTFLNIKATNCLNSTTTNNKCFQLNMNFENSERE